MKLLKIIKYILAIVSIVFLFVNLKVAIGVFLLASIFHIIPFGPNYLFSVITGYLIIGGVVYLFFDWRIGVVLIVAGFLVTKFRIWANEKNFDYYQKEEKPKNNS